MSWIVLAESPLGQVGDFGFLILFFVLFVGPFAPLLLLCMYGSIYKRISDRKYDEGPSDAQSRVHPISVDI